MPDLKAMDWDQLLKWADEIEKSAPAVWAVVKRVLQLLAGRLPYGAGHDHDHCDDCQKLSHALLMQAADTLATAVKLHEACCQESCEE